MWASAIYQCNTLCIFQPSEPPLWHLSLHSHHLRNKLPSWCHLCHISDGKHSSYRPTYARSQESLRHFWKIWTNWKRPVFVMNPHFCHWCHHQRGESFIHVKYLLVGAHWWPTLKVLPPHLWLELGWGPLMHVVPHLSPLISSYIFIVISLI